MRQPRSYLFGVWMAHVVEQGECLAPSLVRRRGFAQARMGVTEVGEDEACEVVVAGLAEAAKRFPLCQDDVRHLV